VELKEMPAPLNVDCVFEDAPLMLTLAQITFTQSPEVFENITEIKAKLSKLGMPIAQKRQQTNFTIRLGGTPAPQVMQNEIWWFSSLDRKRAAAIAQNSITLYLTDYKDFSDFSSLLSKITSAVITAAGDGCFLTAVALRYLSGFPSDGTPSPYLIPSLHGLPTDTLQTDHFHHKYEFWCTSEEGGRLVLNVRTVHGNELVPRDLQVAGVSIDEKFSHRREVDAVQLDIHETIQKKNPERISEADIQVTFSNMRQRIKSAFLLLTTDKAHQRWSLRCN
jgi:uncharacterized protein (TIGR04255 family)